MGAVHLRYAVYGLFFGFSLSRIGFSDFGEVHRMFLFTDLRMFLTFAGSVVLISACLHLLSRGNMGPARPIHKGTIVGGILFGVGWAVTGACPSIGLVQLGEGQLPALFTLAGMVFGTWLYPIIHGRYFGWDRSSCDS